MNDTAVPQGAFDFGARDIGVVVVTYASASTIERCLSALLSARHVVRIMVVDNGSHDDTCTIVERLAVRDPRIGLVRNTDNRGFAAACNQGATAIAQPWIAFVNPDAFVERDTLARLAEVAMDRPGAGLLGVEHRDEAGNPDPASRRSDPSLREQLFSFGRRDNLFMGRDPGQAVQPVEAVSGALIFMPAVLFARLGSFDEGYRLHAEDLDLCRRVRQAGYDVLVANDLVVTHLRGVSSRRRPAWVELQKHRGMWRYFRKFEAGQTPLWLRPLLFTALWLHLPLALARQAWRRRKTDGATA